VGQQTRFDDDSTWSALARRVNVAAD
jgi:hypothetical protein